MEKMFNFISVIGGLVGGFIVSLFGGWDVMLYTILLFAILDYFTGILKAVYKKELSSAIGFKGIVKKIMVFVVIAVAYNVQRMTGDTIPLREIVIVFFICNEALSILENAAEFINIPQQLKDVLLQLRDKNAAKAEEKEEISRPGPAQAPVPGHPCGPGPAAHPYPSEKALPPGPSSHAAALHLRRPQEGLHRAGGLSHEALLPLRRLTFSRKAG